MYTTDQRSTLPWLGDDRFAEEIQPLYDELRPVLMGMFARRFGMPARDAEVVLQKVFITFMSIQSMLHDRQKWLAVAACDAAAEWERANGRGGDSEMQDAESLDLQRAILRTLSVRDALTVLPAPQREAVRLRYFEKLTFEEIGARMRMSAEAAKALVDGGVRRLLRVTRRKP